MMIMMKSLLGGFALIAGVQGYDQATSGSIDGSETQENGGYGQFLSCPQDFAVSKLCSSGKNADCNGHYTEMFCKQYDLDESKSDELNGQSWGDWIDCSESGGDYVLAGVCTSGGDKDCNGHPFQAQCQPIEPTSPYYLASDTEVKCCKYGEMCECQEGWVVTSLCTSGSNDDCKSSYCSGGDNVYTGLVCTKVASAEHITYAGYWRGGVNGMTSYEATITYDSTNTESQSTEEDTNMQLSESMEMKGTDGFCTVTTKMGIKLSVAYSSSEQSSLSTQISGSASVDCAPPDFSSRYGELDNLLGKPSGTYTEYNTQLFQWIYDASSKYGKLASLPKCLFVRQPQGAPPPLCPYEAAMDPLYQDCCTDADGNYDYAFNCQTSTT